MNVQSTTNATLTPSGRVIPSEYHSLSNQICFTNPRPKEPLQPLVQTSFKDDSGELQVSAVVFIDKNIAIPTSGGISVNFDDRDPAQPLFHVCYNAPETDGIDFMAYQVNFTLSLSQRPPTIQTILWDIDPKGSRGTITTVQTA